MPEVDVRRVGQWSETGWHRPQNMQLYVKQILWHGPGVSKVTGENVDLNYYVSESLQEEEFGDVAVMTEKDRLAYMMMDGWVMAAVNGIGYLPFVSRAGYLHRYISDSVEGYLAMKFDDLVDHLVRAAEMAIHDYDSAVARILRLGGTPSDAVSAGGAGIAIPIIPMLGVDEEIAGV